MTTTLSPNQKITSLVGHEHVLQMIAAAKGEGRLHHSWIFTGPVGIGKYRLAQHIACWLFSTSKNEDLPISSHDFINHPQSRFVLSGAHPDLLIIQPSHDEKNKSGQIKTEQIRKLTQFFSHSATAGGWRIAIVDSLDDVNQNGQNAMLKTLEEPPSMSLIMLLSSRGAKILPTIRSRTNIALLSPLKSSESKAVLEQIFPDIDTKNREILSDLTKGAPGMAVQLSAAGVIPLFQAFCHLLVEPKTASADFAELAEKWDEAGRKSSVLHQATYYLFDDLLCAACLYAISSKLPQMPSARYVVEAVQYLATHFEVQYLATMHQQFTTNMEQSVKLYLGLASILRSFFLQFHSQNITK